MGFTGKDTLAHELACPAWVWPLGQQSTGAMTILTTLRRVFTTTRPTPTCRRSIKTACRTIDTLFAQRIIFRFVLTARTPTVGPSFQIIFRHALLLGQNFHKLDDTPCSCYSFYPISTDSSSCSPGIPNIGCVCTLRMRYAAP